MKWMRIDKQYEFPVHVADIMIYGIALSDLKVVLRNKKDWISYYKVYMAGTSMPHSKWGHEALLNWPIFGLPSSRPHCCNDVKLSTNAESFIKEIYILILFLGGS